MSESSVEMQEVGRAYDPLPGGRRGCSTVAAIRDQWPTSQLAQQICLQQQGLSRHIAEVRLAAMVEDLQLVAEALHSCQAAHAQAAVTASSSAATGTRAFLHMAQAQLSCQQKCLSAWEAALQSTATRSCSS